MMLTELEKMRHFRRRFSPLLLTYIRGLIVRNPPPPHKGNRWVMWVAKRADWRDHKQALEGYWEANETLKRAKKSVCVCLFVCLFVCFDQENPRRERLLSVLDSAIHFGKGRLFILPSWFWTCCTSPMREVNSRTTLGVPSLRPEPTLA